MAQLTVRGLSDEVIARLKAAAAAEGKSLNKLARGALEERAERAGLRAGWLRWAEEAEQIQERIRARLGHDMEDMTVKLLNEDRWSR